MSRSALFLTLCSIITISWNGVAQSIQDAASASPAVQVLYIVEGNTLTTYNVDPQTLKVTQMGSLSLESAGVHYYNLFMPRGDRFLYVATVSSDFRQTQRFAVYRTDAFGVPQEPPTQVTPGGGHVATQFDPHHKFAYSAVSFPDGGANVIEHIRRYLVNPNTGALSDPVSEAKYVLPDYGSGLYCYVSFVGWDESGFNASGTVAYETFTCGGPEGQWTTYYERTVDPHTGALGPDVKVFSSSVDAFSGGYNTPYFVNKLIFNFVSPNDWQSGVNSVDIYPLVPNSTAPLLHCTGEMLEACGNSTGLVHPSGKYLFMQISDVAQIDRVELALGRIVDTGNYVPTGVRQFSPDGTLVYGVQPESLTTSILQIYGFDVKTSEITTGPTLWFDSQLPNFFVTERF